MKSSYKQQSDCVMHADALQSSTWRSFEVGVRTMPLIMHRPPWLKMRQVLMAGLDRAFLQPSRTFQKLLKICFSQGIQIRSSGERRERCRWWWCLSSCAPSAGKMMPLHFWWEFLPVLLLCSCRSSILPFLFGGRGWNCNEHGINCLPCGVLKSSLTSKICLFRTISCMINMNKLL